jgi:hypothetical protein
LTLELDVALEPISGSLDVAGVETPQAFCGWLELTSLIERARLGAMGDMTETLSQRP